MNEALIIHVSTLFFVRFLFLVLLLFWGLRPSPQTPSIYEILKVAKKRCFLAFIFFFIPQCRPVVFEGTGLVPAMNSQKNCVFVAFGAFAAFCLFLHHRYSHHQP